MHVTPQVISPGGPRMAAPAPDALVVAPGIERSPSSARRQDRGLGLAASRGATFAVATLQRRLAGPWRRPVGRVGADPPGMNGIAEVQPERGVERPDPGHAPPDSVDDCFPRSLPPPVVLRHHALAADRRRKLGHVERQARMAKPGDRSFGGVRAEKAWPAALLQVQARGRRAPPGCARGSAGSGSRRPCATARPGRPSAGDSRRARTRPPLPGDVLALVARPARATQGP